MKLVILFVIIFTFFKVKVNGHCEEKEYIPLNNEDDFPEGVKRVTIRCFNVTSSNSFDFDYDGNTYIQELIIDSTTSRILNLDSNSRTIIKINTIIFENVSLEVIAPHVFDNYQTLEKIDLSSNNLRKISNGTFNKLENLKILDLEQNSIEILEHGCFFGLSKLEYLDISNNKITELDSDIFKDLINLGNLDISDNFIKNIPTVEYFIKSPHLLLRNNRLTTVDFVDFPRFTLIDLSKNGINSVDNWEKLNTYAFLIEYNNLTQVEILPKMITLRGHHNQISKIINKHSDEDKIITSLDLSFNEISDINSDSFAELKDLMELDLNHNKITTLHENTFKDCASLYILNLSYNQIQNVEKDAFKGLSSSVTIDISYNNLKILKIDSFPQTSENIKLRLTGNEINSADLKILENNFKTNESDYEEHHEI